MTDPHASTPAVPWRDDEPPKSILAIRLQALGDVVITLPYLRALRYSLPGTDIDFLTRQEDGSIPRALRLFRSVEELGGGRSERRQLLWTPLIAPRLRKSGPRMSGLQARMSQNNSLRARHGTARWTG